MKHQWIAKLGLLVGWPLLALLMAAMTAFVLVAAWLLIPFGEIKRKDDDSGYTMAFPWMD